MEHKKRCTVYVGADAVDKVQRVLSKAGVSFSAYVSVMIDAFASIIEETSMEEKMKHMSLSQCLGMLSEIMGKIEKETDEDLEKGVAKLKSLTAAEGVKSVKEKES